MTLKILAANMIELRLVDKHILISYQTPVAYAKTNGGVGNGMTYWKTRKFWSNTTSRHINKWLRRYGIAEVKEIEQSTLDNLLNEVK